MGKQLKWSNSAVISRSGLLQTVILALLSLTTLSGAQEPGGQTDQNEAKGIVFTAITLSKLPYEKVYYRNGAKFTEIKWRKGRRTIPYSLSKAKSFEIFVEHDDPKNPYKLIGQAPLVAGTNKMLFFFTPNETQKEGALPVRLYGLDDSERIFPESSYRFINFTSVPLVIEFNKKSFHVTPGKPTVKKLTLSKDGAFTPLVVRGRKGKLLAATRSFSHASNRKMALIFPHKKGSKRMDIRYFSD